MNNVKLAVSIIIVGYRSQPVLPDCFDAILKQVGCASELIYVENCPEYSAKVLVNEKYPFIKVIESEKNAGFGAGCNLGARDAKGDYLLFLNPDAEIKTIDTLKNMVDFMQAHPQVGVSAPLFSQLDETSLYGVQGRDISTSYSGQKEVGLQFHALPGDIAWVCGAALMIPKCLFEKIGGFDEQYFMYSEDVDLCLTVRKAGFSIAQVMNTNVMHRGSESTKSWGTSQMIYRTTASDFLFTQKHYTPEQHARIWKKRKRRYSLHLIANIFLNWRKFSRYLMQLRAIMRA
ncbi:MAG: glycosyltransferase family 2 protein [Coxiellaceae bacterium]|nr:glycosyltransferase family 2 protein [Coxiellaceae bacterium]